MTVSAQETSAPSSAAAAPATPEFDYASEWQALIDTNDHNGAVELARTWVTDASVQFGERATETFVPLTRLASAYAANDQHALAAKTYREAIKVGERRIGVFSPALVDPLVGLGTALSAIEEHADSISPLLRAKDITHRNQGIYNTTQAAIVDKLTENYLSLDDVQQAMREQLLRYGAAERLVGAGNPEVVPALLEWAKFNGRLSRYRDARKELYRAIELLENAYGPNDIRLVEPLNLIAQTFYSNEQSKSPREGARALRRTVAIYKAQETVDHADLLRAEMALGDWYVISRQRERGLQTYRDAIAIAREAGLSDETIDALYSQPRVLSKYRQQTDRMRPPIRGFHDTTLKGVQGKVVFEFDVDERGRAKNIRVVETTVRKLAVINMLRNRISQVVFRPRFENGAPVVTEGLRRGFSFQG